MPGEHTHLHVRRHTCSTAAQHARFQAGRHVAQWQASIYTWRLMCSNRLQAEAWERLRLPHRMKWKHRARRHAATLHNVPPRTQPARSMRSMRPCARQALARPRQRRLTSARLLRAPHMRSRLGCKRILLWHLCTAMAAPVRGSQQQAYQRSFRVALGAGERAGRRHELEVCRHGRLLPSTSSLLGRARLPRTACLVHVMITS